jgi:hypothetical protein
MRKILSFLCFLLVPEVSAKTICLAGCEQESFEQIGRNTLGLLSSFGLGSLGFYYVLGFVITLLIILFYLLLKRRKC